MADQQTAERVGQVLATLEQIQAQLNKIEYTLNGNGTPGIKTRLDRVEQTHGRQRAVLLFLSTLVTALFGTVCAAALKVFHGD